MSALGLLLIGAGIVLIAVGYRRAIGPWRRYQGLKAQDENVARYEAWRGGIRDDSRTGASVAMEMYRGQARTGVTIGIIGFAAVFAGFVLR